MRRVIVAGGTGFFGGAAVALLRNAGIDALTAARSPAADLVLDVEDRDALRRVLRRGDVILDAAGPFQLRTTALVEIAIESGCDVVDIADALGYVERVVALGDRAGAAGVSLRSACSTASAVSAALIAWSGAATPIRLSVFLVPSTRHTAVPATAASLLSSVGRPIRILRGGRLVTAPGFRSPRRWRGGTPLGLRRGWPFETPDALTLPMAFPTLRTVEWHVDPNVPGLGRLLDLAGRSRPLRGVLRRLLRPALPIARRLGREPGGLGCEVEDGWGRTVRLALTAHSGAYRLAVMPAVLAVRSLVACPRQEIGVLPADGQVDPGMLLEALQAIGFTLFREG